MRVVLSYRGVVSGLILALAALPLPGRADEVSAPAVEIPVWNRSWVGTLGTKTVEVSLQRVADGLRGRYCYQPCSNQTRDVLRLSGRITGEGAELGESDSSRANVATGTWRITSLEKGLTGTWISPNGKRSLPLALRPATAEDALEARFPFELRLVADAPPEEEGDGCPTPPMVSAIRLYKDGQLVQTLATESQGTCGMFTPSLIDANFDGWPDLTIAQFLPAGPNIPTRPGSTTRPPAAMSTPRPCCRTSARRSSIRSTASSTRTGAPVAASTASPPTAGRTATCRKWTPAAATCCR